MATTTNKMTKPEPNFNGSQIARFGHLPRFLVKEHGSKISNILEIKKGKRAINNNAYLKKHKIELIRKLKYATAKYGTTCLIKEGNIAYVAEVLDWEDYGTGELKYLKINYKKTNKSYGSYVIQKEFMIDPKNPTLSQFVSKVTAFSTATRQEVPLEEINGLIGRAVYNRWQKLDTPYIPAELITWDVDGHGPLFQMDELFLLERQLIREIKRDLDLSRKKVLYKTRLARKSAADLEFEMNTKEIVVFEDGNAIFSSPIDLWSPALAIKAITECIDWLMSYALKVTFAAKDSMATGAQKGDKQISEINQAPQNVLEDVLQMWGENLSNFLSMFTGKTVEVEVSAMTTPDNLINGVVDSKQVTTPAGTETPKPGKVVK